MRNNCKHFKECHNERRHPSFAMGCPRYDYQDFGCFQTKEQASQRLVEKKLENFVRKNEPIHN